MIQKIHTLGFIEWCATFIAPILRDEEEVQEIKKTEQGFPTSQQHSEVALQQTSACENAASVFELLTTSMQHYCQSHSTCMVSQQVMPALTNLTW